MCELCSPPQPYHLLRPSTHTLNSRRYHMIALLRMHPCLFTYSSFCLKPSLPSLPVSTQLTYSSSKLRCHFLRKLSLNCFSTKIQAKCRNSRGILQPIIQDEAISSLSYDILIICSLFCFSSKPETGIHLA